MKGLAEFIVRRRLPILLVIAVLTLFFGYHATRVEMYTVFSDLLPKDHPYINVHNEFRRIFGGANLILLSVEVKEGDIFNNKTLQKNQKAHPGGGAHARGEQLPDLFHRPTEGERCQGLQLGSCSEAGHVAGCSEEPRGP